MPPAQARLLQTFLSRSRCLALARGATLPAESHGTCMFADISGFTPLTEALIHQGYSLTALRKLQETVGAYQGVPGLLRPDRTARSGQQGAGRAGARAPGARPGGASHGNRRTDFTRPAPGFG